MDEPKKAGIEGKNQTVSTTSTNSRVQQKCEDQTTRKRRRTIVKDSPFRSDYVEHQNFGKSDLLKRAEQNLVRSHARSNWQLIIC